MQTIIRFGVILKFGQTIRPVNFVISFRGCGEVRSHLEIQMILEFRHFDDFCFGLNSPRSASRLASISVEVGIRLRTSPRELCLEFSGGAAAMPAVPAHPCLSPIREKVFG